MKEKNKKFKLMIVISIIILIVIIGVIFFINKTSSKNSKNSNSNIEQIATYSSTFSESKDGLEDFIILFNYKTTDRNMELPTSGVTLNIGNNTYTAKENSFCQEYISFEKYSDYIHLYNQKTVLSGSDPIKMFLVFLINPNDLTSNDSAILTIGDEKTKLNISDTKKIDLIDQVLETEDDYETAQRLAAFKIRVDFAYSAMEFIGRNAFVHANGNNNLGDQFSGMSKYMKNIFASDQNWGYTIGGYGKESGFSGTLSKQGIYNNSYMKENLPNFDLNLVLETYPDIKDDINNFINNFNTMADIIVTPSSTRDSFTQTTSNIQSSYNNIMKYFNLK